MRPAVGTLPCLLAVCLCAVAASAGLPEPEETAALLLSPAAVYRARGRAVLDGDPGREYERAVVAVVGQRAGERGAWIDELDARAEEASGPELLRIQRMLDALRGARDATIGVDLYFVAVPPALARRILGEGEPTVAHAAPGAWEEWWRRIRADKSAEVILRRALPTRDTREAAFRAVRRTSYVKRYDSEKTGDAVVLDPVVDAVEAGVAMRWRPHLSDDGAFVTLDCAIEVSELVQPIASRQLEIEGHTVQIQVPEVHRLEMGQSVTLPVGGHCAWRLPEPGAKDDARVVLVLLRAVLGDPLPVEAPAPAPESEAGPQSPPPPGSRDDAADRGG